MKSENLMEIDEEILIKMNKMLLEENSPVNNIKTVLDIAAAFRSQNLTPYFMVTTDYSKIYVRTEETRQKNKLH